MYLKVAYVNMSNIKKSKVVIMKKLLLSISFVFLLLACSSGKKDDSSSINVALLDFGNVIIGSLSELQSITIINTLSEAAYLSVNLFDARIGEDGNSSFNFDDSTCSRFLTLPSPVAMNPGESCKIKVDAKPTNFARFTAFFDIRFHAQSYEDRDESEKNLSEHILMQMGLAKYQPALAIVIGSTDGEQIPPVDAVYEFPNAFGDSLEIISRIFTDATEPKTYTLKGNLSVRTTQPIDGWYGYYTLTNNDSSANQCVVTENGKVTVPAGGCNLAVKLRLDEDNIFNNPYFFIPIPDYSYFIPETVTNDTPIQRIRMSVR